MNTAPIIKLHGSEIVTKEQSMDRKFLLPLSEYNRIYQVAHGLLEQLANPNRACIFFASFGSYILNKHYGISSRPVAGSFGLCIEPPDDVLFFGSDGKKIDKSNSEGFHMWVQTKSHIIDFMAPNFPETFSNQNLREIEIPRKMLQKRITEDVSTAAELQKSGDIITFPNPELTDYLVDRFCNSAGNRDLIEIADSWYSGRKKKQKKSLKITDNYGMVFDLNIPNIYSQSSW